MQSFREANGSVLYYISNDGENFIPCSTPLDLTIEMTDPRIGYVRDDDVDYSEILIENPGLTEDEARQMAIQENDKLLRKKGFMKAPDSYGPYNSGMRYDPGFCRRIVCEMYMEPDKDYYLRIRQVENNDYSTVAFNYLEIVPYDVYSGENGPEDWH